jgi:nucleotide-binding universal stress UspA family protein
MMIFSIKKILIATDVSVTNSEILKLASQLAAKERAEVILFNVLESLNVKPDGVDIQQSALNHSLFDVLKTDPVKKLLEKQKDQLVKLGVSNVGYMIERGRPYEKILEVAIAIKADIIIMGTPIITREKGFAITSNNYKVVSKAVCPVLSIQPQFAAIGIESILLPFHDKPHSREDVEYAIEIAKIYGAKLHVVGISYDTSEEGTGKIQLEAEQIKKILIRRGVKNSVSVIKGRYDNKLIGSYVDVFKADMLVVMADVVKVSISEYIAGPLLQQLINHSHIPLLTIRPIFNFNALLSGYENINAVDWRPWN